MITPEFGSEEEYSQDRKNAIELLRFHFDQIHTSVVDLPFPKSSQVTDERLRRFLERALYCGRVKEIAAFQVRRDYTLILVVSEHNELAVPIGHLSVNGSFPDQKEAIQRTTNYRDLAGKDLRLLLSREQEYRVGMRNSRGIVIPDHNVLPIPPFVYQAITTALVDFKINERNAKILP